MTVAEKALSWAKKIAADQSHGYSQASRWGNPDYDCSSFVISAYEYAGAGLKSAGATYTGNLRQIALKCGFSDVSAKCNLQNCNGMQKGDILLYHISGTNGHTAMYAGSQKIVHARGKSYGSASPGDQGSEIAVTAYTRSRWQYVLRYTGKKTADNSSGGIDSKKYYTVTASMPLIKYGSVGSSVKLWQTLIGVEPDGEFGVQTQMATLGFQNNHKKSHGLEVDGEVGPKTWGVALSELT